MSNSGAWSGDHYEQLEEMYETIVNSEKLAGRNVTPNDSIRIRAEIAEAYDEVIRCFDKENADPSIVTYTINLMKSTVATTNDLRNISQLAIAISESTIGALYLVNELQEKQKDKELEMETRINFKDENEQRRDDLTKKIDISLNSDVIDALCSKENEKNYEQLNKRAKSGDKDALIAVDLIKKSIHLMNNEAMGKLNNKGKDLAALALVEKLVTTDEPAAITSAEQLIDVFKLEKYDIYTQDENGDKIVSVDKVKREFDRGADKLHARVNLELIHGLEREQGDITAITKRYERDSNNISSMGQMITFTKEKQEAKQILKQAVLLQQTDNNYTERAQESGEDFNIFIANNFEKTPSAVAYGLDFLNRYGANMKNPIQMYNVIGSIVATRKAIQHLQRNENTAIKKYDDFDFYEQNDINEQIKYDNGKSTSDDDGR